jgi:hypothetical protein
MTFKETKNLRVGDKVIWPEGAHGCKQAHGIVDSNQWGLFIQWDDGQQTAIRDTEAIQYVKTEE